MIDNIPNFSSILLHGTVVFASKEQIVEISKSCNCKQINLEDLHQKIILRSSKAHTNKFIPCKVQDTKAKHYKLRYSNITSKFVIKYYTYLSSYTKPEKH
jgi:hypothetical protein